jgi:AraC-like DNA-binding protein/mannose-6-phosphate isomerase-like protein (cupin superfamily)
MESVFQRGSEAKSMKAAYQYLNFDTADYSILCQRIYAPHFVFYWHYHPEVELTYVIKGEGTRLVGDSVEDFKEGDLVLLGSKLPHTWISEKDLVGRDSEIETFVLQFPKSVIEPQIYDLPELRNISQLIKAAHRGLQFSQGASAIAEKMNRLTQVDAFERYHFLFELLNDLSQMEGRYLASELYIPDLKSESEGRIGKVCTYVHNHYAEHLEVPQLAALADMNEAAFCRFFKKMTGKTAITYINDLRIGMACELLQENALRIGEIGYRSGYKSITHFNRSFLKRKNITPSEFRKQYMKKQHDLINT